jgi:hypothetical protein
LQSDTTHIHVQAGLDDTRRCVGLAAHPSTRQLDQKGDDVKPHEDRAESLRVQTTKSLLLGKEPHHAAKGHVEEGVDPERGQKEKQLVISIVVRVVLLFDQQGPQDHRDRFPDAPHHHYPSIFLLPVRPKSFQSSKTKMGTGYLAVDEDLHAMYESSQAKEESEKDCGAKRGHVEQYVSTSLWRQIAVFPWCHTDAGWRCCGGRRGAACHCRCGRHRVEQDYEAKQ